MMEHPILISYLNDFMFCPASIYFHQLYGSMDRILFQCTDQINGTYAHNSIDNGIYSTKKNVLQGIDIYCDRYNIIGKIDVFDIGTGIILSLNLNVNFYCCRYAFNFCLCCV